MIARAEKLGEFLHHNRRRFATVAVAVIACFVAYHAVWGANGWIMYQHKRAEFRELQKRVAAMQEENQRLQRQNQGLKSDPESIEREAREQLHYTRPGEVVYVSPEQQQPSSAINTAQKTNP